MRAAKVKAHNGSHTHDFVLFVGGAWLVDLLRKSTDEPLNIIALKKMIKWKSFGCFFKISSIFGYYSVKDTLFCFTDIFSWRQLRIDKLQNVFISHTKVQRLQYIRNLLES